MQERLGLPWRWVLLGVVLSGVASLAASQWHHQPAFSAAWSTQSHALLERMSALGDQLAHQRCAAARPGSVFGERVCSAAWAVGHGAMLYVLISLWQGAQFVDLLLHWL